MYDIPWMVMDNTEAARDFGWQIEMSLPPFSKASRNTPASVRTGWR